MTSRYSTFRAESQKPIPNAAASIRSTAIGSNSRAAPGTVPNQIISKATIPMASVKSTSAVSAVAIGTTRRGKYTRVMSRWSVMRLFVDSEITREKNCQGTNPASTYNGYGILSDGSCAIRLNNNQKIAIMPKG